MATKVELTANGESEKFGVEHAQAILTYQLKNKVSDWELTDSNFVLENGILKSRGNNKPDKKPKEQDGAIEGSTASE